jgi:hypothetical protein
MKKVFCAYCNKPILLPHPRKSSSSATIKSYGLNFCSLSCRSKYFDEQSSTND